MALKSVGGGGGGGAPGPQGGKGDTGSMILSGPGAPSNAIGLNLDYYFRTDTKELYGPKAAGAWPGSPISLVGPQGDQGPQGSQGIQGIQGPSGSNGAGVIARAIKTSDQLAIGTAYATVTGVDMPLVAGLSYMFEFGLICDADATTTGIDVAVTGPASPTQLHYTLESWTSATAKTFRGATGYDDNPANANSCGATARMFMIRGIIRNGANAGNLSPRAKREAVGSGPNVRAGSYGLLWALS